MEVVNTKLIYYAKSKLSRREITSSLHPLDSNDHHNHHTSPPLVVASMDGHTTGIVGASIEVRTLESN